MEVGGVRREPEEIPDADHELVLERVCAIDVAKASGAVCVRVPHEAKPGQRVSRVWQVPATTRAITDLAARLVNERIAKVTVESTSDYWRIWFYLLEAAGLDVQLVNARDVKNLPGRPKTDKLDSVWLAKLTEKGLLRPSFVPPAPIRRLRDYTRLRVDLTRERVRHYQRLEKLLEDALIKVSSVASKMDSLSVRDMLEALIAGERDPRRLAELARGRMKSKRPALVEALTGRFDEHHAELARMLLDQIDSLSAQIEQLTLRLRPHLLTPPSTVAGRRPIPIPHPRGPSRPAASHPASSPIQRVGFPPGNASMRSPVLGSWPRRSSSPKSGWICAGSRPRTTWFPGPNSARAPSSPVPNSVAARPARATPTSRACSARPPLRPPRPTPSSVPATGASSNAAASSKPSSRSPAPS
jgi:transposase